MTRASSDSSVEGLPTGDQIAAGYERLLEIAYGRLDQPWSCRIRSWEDGTFEIRVWHKYSWPGLNGSIRGVIRWHSEEDEIKAGLFEKGSAANGGRKLIEEWTIRHGGERTA